MSMIPNPPKNPTPLVSVLSLTTSHFLIRVPATTGPLLLPCEEEVLIVYLKRMNQLVEI